MYKAHTETLRSDSPSAGELQPRKQSGVFPSVSDGGAGLLGPRAATRPGSALAFHCTRGGGYAYKPWNLSSLPSFPLFNPLELEKVDGFRKM